MSGDPRCAHEPIHTPGTIQPHGAFLAIEENGRGGVVAASSNAAALLWGEPSLDKVIGCSLADILGQRFAADVQRRRREGRLRGEAPWQSSLRPDGHALALDVTVHAHSGLINVELERASPQDPAAAETALRELQNVIIDLRETGNDLDELARVTAEGVRLLTGYERVIIYKFDTDWNGQGIAEARSDDWDVSLVGLRFPASDIPAQARALYQRSPVRWVADRDSVPTPIIVDPSWRGDAQSLRTIDLSFAYLRSLSPVHLQIHRDLGINGTMSFSILHKERLWGLMIGHHRQAHHLAPAQRSATAALIGAFALRVGTAERFDTDHARRADRSRKSTLLSQMATADDVSAALTTGDVTIGDLFASTGAAVLYKGNLSLLGQTPPDKDVRMLVGWLQKQDSPAALFQTNNLASLCPPWEQHAAVASGVLAVFLSADRADVLLWFRPQQVELVSWGGASRSKTADHVAKLPAHPFLTWVEPRHGLPRPWEEWELEIAETLRHAITEVMVRSLHRIAELQDRLRQSQKMEAVGQLTGGIAHDFNNLLGGILGSLEMLQVRAAQGRYGELERYLGAATTSANRAASLTHRLLAFSRRQMLDAESVDVSRLAASMEDLIRRSVGPSIHVETVMAGGLLADAV